MSIRHMILASASLLLLYKAAGAEVSPQELLTAMELGDSTTLTEGNRALAAGPGGPDAVQGVRVISRGEFAGYWEYLLEHAIYTLPPYSDYE